MKRRDFLRLLGLAPLAAVAGATGVKRATAGPPAAPPSDAGVDEYGHYRGGWKIQRPLPGEAPPSDGAIARFREQYLSASEGVQPNWIWVPRGTEDYYRRAGKTMAGPKDRIKDYYWGPR